MQDRNKEIERKLMSGGRIILNLGCGDALMPKAINCDIKKMSGIDLVFDLEKFPYPFKSCSVDEVHLYFVLEHLDKHLEVINEIYRILRKGGMLFVRVPHGSSCYGSWGEFTHKRGYAVNSFDIFSQSSKRSYYSQARFRISKKKCKYFLTYPYNFYKFNTWFPHWEEKWYSFLIKAYVNLIQFLIDLSPEIFERFWCYWVGGAAEVYVEMEKT